MSTCNEKDSNHCCTLLCRSHVLRHLISDLRVRAIPNCILVYSLGLRTLERDFRRSTEHESLNGCETLIYVLTSYLLLAASIDAFKLSTIVGDARYARSVAILVLYSTCCESHAPNPSAQHWLLLSLPLFKWQSSASMTSTDSTWGQ